MLQYIYGLGALSGFALQNVLFKKVMDKTSPIRALSYRGFLLSLLLIVSSFFLVSSYTVPETLYPTLIMEIVVGAAAVIAFFRALKMGKAGIIGALAQMYVLVVIVIGVLVFGETLSTLKWIGAAILVIGGFMVAFEKFDLRALKLEKGTMMVTATIIGWGIYYSYIKEVVTGVGPYYAPVLLETGIFLLVVLYALARREKLGLPRKEMRPQVFGGGFVIAAGTIAYTLSVEAVGIVLTAMMIAAVPVVNALFARLILKEKLGTIKYISLCLLVIGLALIAVG